MTETTTIEIIPSKVTDDYWIYASNGSEEEGEHEGDPSAEQSATHPDNLGSKTQDNSEKSASADEGQPNRLECQHESKTDLLKCNASGILNGAPVDAALDAVVEALEKIGQTEEVATYTGKWMLFFDQVEEDARGHTAHDRAWLKIAPLGRNGELWSAKASTALKDPKAHTPHLGYICCYTRDYRDQEDVRRQADLIRSSLEEELADKVIYYKTEAATMANQYRVLGSGRVSIYRHKPNYSFWKTSEDNISWDLVHFRSHGSGGRIAPRHHWARHVKTT